jgi:hypothetical protein
MHPTVFSRRFLSKEKEKKVGDSQSVPACGRYHVWHRRALANNYQFLGLTGSRLTDHLSTHAG